MNSWLFQANPRRYDLPARVSRSLDDRWSVNRHWGLVARGDRIFFMVTGTNAGIYVTGRVMTSAYALEREDEFGRWKIDVRYEGWVNPPLLRRELTDPATEPILSTFAPFRGIQGSNFLIPHEVAARLTHMLTRRFNPLPGTTPRS